MVNENYKFIEYILIHPPYNIPAIINSAITTFLPNLREKGSECCKQAISIEAGTYFFLQYIDILESKTDDQSNIFLNEKVPAAEVAHYFGCMLKNPLTRDDMIKPYISAIEGGLVKYTLKRLFNKCIDGECKIFNDKDDNVHNDHTNRAIIGIINSGIYKLDEVFGIYLQNYTNINNAIGRYMIPFIAETLDEIIEPLLDEDKKCKSVACKDKIYSGIKTGCAVILAVDSFYESEKIIEICDSSTPLPLEYIENQINLDFYGNGSLSLEPIGCVI